MSLIPTSIPINLYTTLFLISWQQSYPSEIRNCTCDSRLRHSAQAKAKVVLILLSNPAHSRVISPLLHPILDRYSFFKFFFHYFTFCFYSSLCFFFQVDKQVLFSLFQLIIVILNLFWLSSSNNPLTPGLASVQY